MDTFLEAFTDAAIKMLIALIPILLAVLTRYLVLFLNAQMAKLDKEGKETELLILQELTRIAVLAAEQILEEGPDKFQFAAENLLAMAWELGIPLGADQAQVLIESSVLAIRSELPLELIVEEGAFADGEF